MVALALAGYVAPEQRVRPEPLAPAEDTVVTSTGEEIVRALVGAQGQIADLMKKAMGDR